MAVFGVLFFKCRDYGVFVVFFVELEEFSRGCFYFFWWLLRGVFCF